MKIVIVIVWICMWGITWPALLADIQSIGSEQFARGYCRKDFAFMMALAVLPPTWVVAPIFTGFYEHGMQFSCKRPKDEVAP